MKNIEDLRALSSVNKSDLGQVEEQGGEEEQVSLKRQKVTDTGKETVKLIGASEHVESMEAGRHMRRSIAGSRKKSTVKDRKWKKAEEKYSKESGMLRNWVKVYEGIAEKENASQIKSQVDITCGSDKVPETVEEKLERREEVEGEEGEIRVVRVESKHNSNIVKVITNKYVFNFRKEVSKVDKDKAEANERKIAAVRT